MSAPQTRVSPSFTAARIASMRAARACLAALPLLLGVAFASEESSLRARVVWVRGDRVYLASLGPNDSLEVRAGDRLTFVVDRKSVAAGEVARVYERDLGMARLTSGSLEQVKKLDRLRVLWTRPALSPRPVLRVGCPSRARSNLLFACDTMTIRPPSSPQSYRWDTITYRRYVLVRDSSAAPGPWPDTLIIRLFDEVADQEIALERGELDVAVFWPGEISSHLRDQPRWQDSSPAARPRGVVAAMWLDRGGAARDSAPDLTTDPALATLDTSLFRGDLDAWHPAPPRVDSTARGGSRVRFEVDPAMPGRTEIERFLDRGASPSGEPARSARLFYVDAPATQPEPLARAVIEYVRGAAPRADQRARADAFGAAIDRRDPNARWSREEMQRALRDSLGVSLLFSVRCPVLRAPALADYVHALGVEAFVDLLDCDRKARHP
jgi:hypothetical protein